MCYTALGFYPLLFLSFCSLLVLAVVGRTSNDPNPPPPAGARHVYFREWTAWQSWDYEYRFDAPPEVCKEFAMKLMRSQALRPGREKIEESEFKEFPIRSRFQPWFDVGTVTNGLLLTCDNWSYAVIDRERGRLYYFNCN